MSYGDYRSFTGDWRDVVSAWALYAICLLGFLVFSIAQTPDYGKCGRANNKPAAACADVAALSEPLLDRGITLRRR